MFFVDLLCGAGHPLSAHPCAHQQEEELAWRRKVQASSQEDANENASSKRGGGPHHASLHVRFCLARPASYSSDVVSVRVRNRSYVMLYCGSIVPYSWPQRVH